MSGVDWDSLVLGPVMGIFGEAVTYTPAGGSPLQITGVFDEEYQGTSPVGANVEQLTGPVMDTDRRPILGVQLSQFPAGVTLNQDDQLTVASNGTTYLVKEVRPDGHGAAKLLLDEA